MSRSRVLVVEDSRTIRGRIVDALSADPELEVIGEAEDGKSAIDLCLATRPDVITLDMMLPVMTGLAVTEYLMAYCPTPILIVSASTNRGELFRTYEALAAGALDVLEKPVGTEPEGTWDQTLVSTVKLISRIKVITHPRLRFGHLGQTPMQTEARAFRESEPLKAIGIGASTGGPGAVAELLRGLASGFPIPILLVIHIGESFAPALADWLDGLGALRVSYAREGEPLASIGGRVVMAPPGRHMVVNGGRLTLTQDPPRHSCRPSVDVLFSSMARELGAQAAACLLTGMGKDGAEGLLELRRAGGSTIAQDEASSVVFGMPREAILMGAAEQTLSLGAIAPALKQLCRNSQRRKP
ncbi:MAG: chemotaxis-specific protein-glutamate methyltransferase CheB [Deltaproteobacteria bacterium]|nr:chemotaxis-specific protein-glutamate methyltransferase CheB [Deltaproteobacteria bacterium]